MHFSAEKDPNEPRLAKSAISGRKCTPNSSEAPVIVMACGDSALLVELDNVAEVITIERLLTKARIPGVAEIVTSSKSVLVSLEPGMLLRDVEDDIRAALTAWKKPADQAESDTFRVPVSYGSTDLHECAFLMDTTVEDIIGWHSQLEWKVIGMTGEPGVFSLSSDNNPIDFGRRAVHRRVPEGSIILADRSCIVVGQPVLSDGYVIGQTNAVIWDPLRNPVSLLTTGMVLSFQEENSAGTSRRSRASHVASP